MEPNVHLRLHEARVAAAVRRHEQLQAQRPRPPGRGRQGLARWLRRAAGWLEPAEQEQPRPVAHPAR